MRIAGRITNDHTADIGRGTYAFADAPTLDRDPNNIANRYPDLSISLQRAIGYLARSLRQFSQHGCDRFYRKS
jgi:hypothetical protein